MHASFSLGGGYRANTPPPHHILHELKMKMAPKKTNLPLLLLLLLLLLPPPFFPSRQTANRSQMCRRPFHLLLVPLTLKAVRANQPSLQHIS